MKNKDYSMVPLMNYEMNIHIIFKIISEYIVFIKYLDLDLK
jgi:hypothetical protein